MTAEERLREALESAVPEPPGTQSWGGEARDRDRHLRRRRTGTVLGLAAALVLAVPVVRTLHHDGGTPAATAPTVVPGVFRCPDPQAEAASDHGSDALPTGATAVRLCLHDNNIAWVPPEDVLTTDPDALVGVVNAQRIHHPQPDTACGGVGAPAWSMVFRYPDGIRTVSGDNGGCWDLLVGATQRFGSRTVYHAYLQAVLRQRRVQGPPDVAHPRPTCPPTLRTDGAFSPVADASRITSAVLCVTHRARVSRQIPLTGPELARLRHDFATAPTRRTGGHGSCRAVPFGAGVVGVDPWGDPVSVLISCGTYRILQPGSDRYLFARMLPATKQMLAGLVTS